MTESRIRGMRAMLEKLMGLLDGFLTEARELEIRERQVERKRDLMSQKETKILSDQAGVKDQTHDLDVKIKEFNSVKAKSETAQQKLRVGAGKMQKQREVIKREQLELNEKISTVVEIQEREREVKEREDELESKATTLASKQATITKDVQIARDRKLKLDEREKSLEKDKAKIQKYLNI